MLSSKMPPCPKCGNLSPEKISEQRTDLSGAFTDLFGGFIDKPLDSPNEMIDTFRCPCGTTFTHRDIHGTSRHGTLAVKAMRLQRMIGNRVDDPNDGFMSDEGERCIADLRATAQQCA